MADDLSTMKARISAELARPDFLSTDSRIASAITDAIKIYQKERFRFSDVNPTSPPTFSTVAARWVYTSADNANIASLFKIDYLMVLIGNTQQLLTYDTPQNIRLYNQQGTMSGQPLWWGYEGNQILLAPVPAEVWTVTMGLFRNIAAPATDLEASNPWMVEAERLIRSRAKYEIAMHVTRNATLAKAMSPHPPQGGESEGHEAYWAWRELKAETNRVTGSGRIKAMQF